MAEHLSVETALGALRSDVDRLGGPLPDYAALVRARLAPPPPAAVASAVRAGNVVRRSVVAAGVAAAVAAASLSALAVRQPWSPQGSTETVAADRLVGAAVPLSVAVSSFPYDLNSSASAVLGEPLRVILGEGQPSPYVSMLYSEPLQPGAASRVVTPEALVQIAGDASGYFDVMQRAHPAAQRVRLGDRAALWLPEPVPLVYSDADGYRSTLAPRTSFSALVWVAGGVTYRLESDATLVEATRVASRLLAG